jgi:hypothetical protein
MLSTSNAVTTFKRGLIGTAWNNFRRGARSDLRDAYEKFRIDQARWLDDYALFRALKTRYNGAYYVEWPSDLVYREPSAMARARRELKDEIDQITFAQFLFFRQAGGLRNMRGARAANHWRSAVFRLPRLERRLGESRILRPRRQPPSTFCRGGTAGLFRGAGTALGQSGLQLGGAEKHRVPLVPRSPARSAGIRRRYPARSLPRLCCRLAGSRGSAYSRDRNLGGWSGR